MLVKEGKGEERRKEDQRNEDHFLSIIDSVSKWIQSVPRIPLSVINE